MRSYCNTVLLFVILSVELPAIVKLLKVLSTIATDRKYVMLQIYWRISCPWTICSEDLRESVTSCLTCGNKIVTIRVWRSHGRESHITRVSHALSGQSESVSKAININIVC